MRSLSKSKIIAYRQCPKRLWLEIHRPELRDDSAFEMVFRIGNQVGDVRRGRSLIQGIGRGIQGRPVGFAVAGQGRGGLTKVKLKI